MTIHARPPRRGIQAVYADGSTRLIQDIQAAVAEMRRTTEEQLASKANKNDVVSAEKVQRIDASISDLTAKLAELANRQAAADLGGGGRSAAKMAKRVEAFRRHSRADVSAEEYKAYREALPTFLRRGAGSSAQVKAALSVASDPDGGYTVTPDITGRIVKRVFDTSPMRQLASVVTISTDSIEGFNDLDETEAGWVGERQPRPATATPGIGKWSIAVHELYANPYATQKLLDDSSWNIEGWLAEKTATRFARLENAAFIAGNGVGKPRGLLTYQTAATPDSGRPWEVFEHRATGVNGGFAATNPGDALVDLVFSLKSTYREAASWLMSRSTLAAVRKLKDGNGNYLWQPDFTQRAGGQLLGYPVVEGEDMPAIATGSLSIAFGDFKEAYTIVDREGIRVLRDPFSVKPFVHFYTTKRTGGGAINFDAVKFLKFSA